jgi:quinol-cytochrome oxidoreductase complex cytochrome b subunit
MSDPEQHEQEMKGRLERLADWFDGRLGLSHELLRPAPRYSINPFYWLGALAVVAFVIQGITGIIMLFYYVPTPASAYASTLYIFQYVSFGQFLETVHLYTAYAMIMLAFMHMMRGYFVSVHKKPREIMWVTGMLMGFVTLGFGFTGYLLPGTVTSQLATNVGTAMIGVLPQPFQSFISFLVVGNGGNATELLRFFDLHVIVLPAVLLVLLAVKMYMLEAHGVSEPVTGGTPISEGKVRLLPFFPDVSIYLLELAALFGAAMLLISALFPLVLAPIYSPATVSQVVSQPDWYFLWIYQILKISAFEHPLFTVEGLKWALSIVSLIFVLLVLLPFIDRGDTRRIARRPIYVTLGLVFTAELVVLTIWGHLTPGIVIPNTQAALVLGGTALLVGLVSFSSYKLLPKHSALEALAEDSVSSSSEKDLTRWASVWTSGIFVAVLGVGALSIGGSINSVVIMATFGVSAAQVANLAFFLLLLAASVAGAAFLLYRLDLGRGKIKRRVKAFEVGWKE